MKNKCFALLFAVIATTVGSVSMAQFLSPPADLIEDFKPSSTNQPGQDYPQVNSQGCIRFKINAPQAQSVSVIFPFGKAKAVIGLRKSEDGSWMKTTGKFGEGFYYYHINIDEGMFNDPGALNFYGNSRWESGIELPAKDQDFYALKDVPHGFVQQILFLSNSTSTSCRAFVYTPPGYQNNTTRYPVLYLQHRQGENETTLNNQGRANLIMDNLIADGIIKPFIIVMTYGTTDPADVPAEAFGRLNGLNHADAFKTVLADELVPYMDANFRTIANQANRAIAGMSIGPTIAFTPTTNTLIRPDVFSYYGLFGGGIYVPTDIKDKTMVKLIFMTTDNGFGTGIKNAANAATALKEAGINTVSCVLEDSGNNVLSWRRSLYKLAQQLFK